MPYVDVDGTPVYCQVTGNGPALVFLHGLGFDHRSWERQVQAFAPRYRCICVDRRGHGKSGDPVDGWSAAHDLAAVLDRLQVASATVVGLSQGGWDAACFALEYPQRTAALVLADAWLQGHPVQSWAGPPVMVARSEGPAAASRAWLGDPLFVQILARPLLGAVARQWIGQHDWRGFRVRAKEARPAVPYQERLADIAAPALVICGEHDVPDFRTMAGRFAAEIPGAGGSVAWLPCGHMSSLEDATGFNALLAGFLRRYFPA